MQLGAVTQFKHFRRSHFLPLFGVRKTGQCSWAQHTLAPSCIRRRHLVAQARVPGCPTAHSATCIRAFDKRLEPGGYPYLTQLEQTDHWSMGDLRWISIAAHVQRNGPIFRRQLGISRREFLPESDCSIPPRHLIAKNGCSERSYSCKWLQFPVTVAPGT